MQEMYDLLVQDIKLLVQYDDKYMKTDNTNIIKPNILNDLEHKMKELKQKQSNILVKIKTNNDKKELLEIDINNISIKQTEIERKIRGLNNNTNMIQEEQQEDLDLINSKCKELEEFIDTILNKSYQDTIKKILQLFTDNYNLLLKTIINDKLFKERFIRMYLNFISNGVVIKDNKIYDLINNNFVWNKLSECTIGGSNYYIQSEPIESMTEDFKIFRNGLTDTINNMNKIIEEQLYPYLNNINQLQNLYKYNPFYSVDECIRITKNIYKYNNWFHSNHNLLFEKFKSIDNLFCSKNDKLLFTNHIFSTITKIFTNYKLESYNEHSIKNLLFDFQLIKKLQNNIIINNVKIFALENTHLDYRKEMKKNNIYDNNNYRSPSCEHTNFIEFTKLKETIKKLEEMEIEISNQLEQLKNTEINVESIEQHLKLTKMHKDIKNENNDNIKQLSLLEISINAYIYNRNKFIKKHTYSNQEYFSNLTKLISNILDKPIDIITIDNINIYNEKLLQLEKKTEEQQEKIILLCKFINDLQIDIDKSNNDNIKIIQTSIKKEIELNTNITKNIDILKQNNEEIQQILTLNKNLDAELTMYNSELSKFQDEYTIIEKVYNLRKLYSV